MNQETDCDLSGLAPNDHYKKFFARFDEINSLEPASFKPVHLLAYFCKKYKEHYDIDYKFKYNSPSPSKCFEIFQIKKLCLQLTSDPMSLIEYIDWVFSQKVVLAKKKWTSISFLTKEEFLREYKTMVLRSRVTVDRSTPLPDKYKAAFDGKHFDVNTYGDLAFLFQISEPLSDIIEMFQALEKLGFDKNILEKII